MYERRLPNDLAITKAALEAYRAEPVAVAVESTFNSSRAEGPVRGLSFRYPLFSWGGASFYGLASCP